MTSWPWMKDFKDEDVLLNPIDPVTSNDDRPAIATLIKENRKDIDAIRKDLVQTYQDLYDATKHDDLWILRFLLSHKKVKRATEAAKVSLIFRDEYKLDEKDIRFSPDLQDIDSPGWQKLTEYSLKPGAYSFTIPDQKRGVAAYMQFADIDQNVLAEKINDEEMFDAMLHVTEWSFQWCDCVTRTTGRLTKQVRIVGMKDFAFMSMLNTTFMSRQGEATKKIEDCYPQLLGTLFICDAPIWIDVPWKIVRPFLPKRVVSKADFIKPTTNKQDKRKFYKFLSPENLPTVYGGKCTTWPLPKVPNKETVAN